MVRDDVANETQRSIVLAFAPYGQDEVLAPYIEKYLAVADTIWEDKGTQRASTVLEFIFPKYLASPSSSTGSTPGWSPRRPTRPPSATSGRTATTSPGRSEPRRRTQQE